MRYCMEQGCRTFTDDGHYCGEHKRGTAKKKAGRQEPSNQEASQAKPYVHSNKSLYNSAVWKRLTAYVYERDRGKCQRCFKFVHGKVAHTHHVIPVEVDRDLELDPANLKLLCASCHPIEERELNLKKVPDYFKKYL